MSNHFDSVICICGEEEEVDKCCQDFEASKIKLGSVERLCFCQFIDPLPSIVFYNDGEMNLKENRLLTLEERLIIDQYFTYPYCWWGIGCEEGHLERCSKFMAKYTFRTPKRPLAKRLFNIFHLKYPKLYIVYEGVDEGCPDNYVRYVINENSPIMTMEEINNDHKNETRRKLEEEFIRKISPVINNVFRE